MQLHVACKKAVIAAAAAGALVSSPALAGSTLSAATTCGLRKNHPRSRGEHSERGYYVWVEEESSPLSRGAPHSNACG